MESLLSICGSYETLAPSTPWPDAVPSLFAGFDDLCDKLAQTGTEDDDALCLLAVLPANADGWRHAMLVYHAASSARSGQRVWVAASSDFTPAGRAVRQDAYTFHQNWQGLVRLEHRLSATLAAKTTHGNNSIDLYDASRALLDLAQRAVADGLASTLGMRPMLGRDLPDQLRDGAVGRYIPLDGPHIHAVFLNAHDTSTLLTKVVPTRQRARARLSACTLENAAAKRLAQCTVSDGFDTLAHILPRHLYGVVAAHALDQACQRDDRTTVEVIARALEIESVGLAGRRLPVAVALAIDRECA
ncbi:hypothetical protein TW95_gp1558 [Pandoravirus inopinatum]|uniref:DUF5897 domain-containing protein n=1 Tax=Pandoravirus inopinatum TaxID=1605721 RepID=A0A0B5JES5_9VIRU|nr:hypothetical protein TW95_gp1558 [Pandoravirus inopinatum]AJF98292.1 hypothetical protein [Pandoravirus inopinatum]